MQLLDLCGYLAAIFTTVAYIPQALKTWRTSSTGDLSLSMLTLLVTGLLLWFAYGIGKGDPPIIIGNAVTLLLAGMVLFFKMRHG